MLNNFITNDITTNQSSNNFIYRNLFISQVWSNNQLLIDKFLIKSLNVNLYKDLININTIGTVDIVTYFSSDIDLIKLLNTSSFIINCIILSSTGKQIMIYKFTTKNMHITFNIDYYVNNEYVFLNLSSEIINYEVINL